MSTYPAAAGALASGAPASRPLLSPHVERRLDQIAVFVWVLCTTIPMPGAAPLRYLLVAYFMAGMFIYGKKLLPLLARCWPLFLLPVMFAVSAIWAPSVGDAIKKGMLMGLTGLVAVYLAGKFGARQVIYTYFAVELIAGVMCVMQPNIIGGVANGIFGQKNFLAINMFLLYTSGLVLLLDTQISRIYRLPALIGLPIALYFIYMSQSATTMVFAAGATAALLGHRFVWEPAARVRHLRMLSIMVLAIVVLIAVLVLFGLFQLDAGKAVLEALGKDSTLTGRTYLWETARRIMAEHPWTGVGAEGFWRPELGQARSITTFFHYQQFVKFSFHNSYLEIGVHLGYPGMYAAILLATWCLFNSVKTWLFNQNTLNGFFLIITALVVIRSNTETDLNTELSGTLVLLFVAAARGALRKEAAPADISPAPAPSFNPPPAPTRGWNPGLR